MAASDENIPKNPNYVVTIRRVQPDPEIVIQAGLPESFAFGVNANYEPRLPNSITDVAGQKFGAASIFLPVNRVLQEFSHQVWQSSSPIEFSLPLLFDAKKDARVDVLNPIKTLMMMALPFKKTPEDILLEPPGPTLLDPNRGRISLRIGNFLYIHSVLLVDVNPTWDTRMNKAGVPISASCDVTLRTVNTPTQGDISEFFMSDANDEYQGYGIPNLNRDSFKSFTSGVADDLSNSASNLADLVTPNDSGVE